MHQQVPILTRESEYSMKTAILGASGLVGRTMLSLLEKADWVEQAPRLLVSSRSAGMELTFRGESIGCEEVGANSFEGMDVALFSAGGKTSLKWGPVAAKAGCWVIDNSSAWRLDPAVPLIVPEINAHHLKQGPGRIIANPNCSTIQIAMALAPIHNLAGIREVQVTTLQAVSGGGQAAVAELREQEAAGENAKAGTAFPRVMAGNVLPAIGARLDDGSYEEEAKVERELRKILDRRDDLAVTCTATRVPVINGHSAAVRVVCNVEVSLAEVTAALEKMPGLKVTTNPHDFATPREISGETDVYVGRLRQDPANPRAFLMWVVADNLLKGAAWNAVQIAQTLKDRIVD